MEIVGFENYLIYPDGKVQNKKTKRYLKPQINSEGYYHIQLRKDKKPHSFMIHRLVGLHYIPNPDNKRCLDHINRIKTDNRVENLRWATDSENQQNRGVQSNNKLGIKNISYNKLMKSYDYKKNINGVNNYKCFKTLEEAIAYKKDYENQNQDLS